VNSDKVAAAGGIEAVVGGMNRHSDDEEVY